MHKILVVDDSEDIRELLRLTMELASGFEVHEAVDGPSAVAAVGALKPDLVLLDIMMPGEFDGAEACRRIKASYGVAAPKVVLVSAKPESAIQEAVAASGADLYIRKPFGPATLVEKLSSLYAKQPFL